MKRTKPAKIKAFDDSKGVVLRGFDSDGEEDERVLSKRFFRAVGKSMGDMNILERLSKNGHVRVAVILKELEDAVREENQAGRASSGFVEDLEAGALDAITYGLETTIL